MKINNKLLTTKPGRQILLEEITYQEFADQFPEETDDDDIEELFSLIEHQPKQGGIFGVNKNRYEQYQYDIIDIIEKLKTRGNKD